jgi:hypothetical protein
LAAAACSQTAFEGGDRATHPGGGRISQERRRALALAALFTALYWITRGRQFSYDALCYALDVERGPLTNLFHPNHLLFSFLNRVVWNAAQFVGFHGHAVTLTQALNALAAGLAVGIFYKRLSCSRPASVALGMAFVFAFGFAFWSEATDAGVYAWTALATVCLFECFLRLPKMNPFWAGVLHGAAVLVHQMLILVAPAFLWRYWKQPGSRKAFIGYVVGLLVTVGAVYGAVIVCFHASSLREAFLWALGPAGGTPEMSVTQNPWWCWTIASNLRDFVRGSVEAFAAARTGGVGATLFCIEAVLVGWLAIRAVARGAAEREPGVQGGAWLWILLLCAFQFFWLPGALRFRLLWLPVFLWLGSAATPEVGEPRHQAWSWWILGIFVFCLNAPVVWSRTAPSLGQKRAQWVSHYVGPKDFLVYEGQGPNSVLNVEMIYFAPDVPSQSLKGYRLTHPAADFSELTQRAEASVAAGGKVFIEGSLIEAAPGLGFLSTWHARLMPAHTYTDDEGYSVVEMKFFQVK